MKEKGALADAALVSVGFWPNGNPVAGGVAAGWPKPEKGVEGFSGGFTSDFAPNGEDDAALG